MLQTITLLFSLKTTNNYFPCLTYERAAIMQTILSFLVCKQTAKVNFSTAGKKCKIKMKVFKRQQKTLISLCMTKKQSHLLLFFEEVSCFILNSEVLSEDTEKMASICQFELCLNVIFLFQELINADGWSW